MATSRDVPPASGKADEHVDKQVDRNPDEHADSPPAYVPPSALRLGQQARKAHGVCSFPGSGEVGWCRGTGSGASNSCTNDGSQAGRGCYWDGGYPGGFFCVAAGIGN